MASRPPKPFKPVTSNPSGYPTQKAPSQGASSLLGSQGRSKSNASSKVKSNRKGISRKNSRKNSRR